MDATPKPPRGGSAAERRRYLEAVKSEFRKMSWTSREELMASTKTVISSIFLFGLGVYVVDLMIKGALDLIRAFARFIVS